MKIFKSLSLSALVVVSLLIVSGSPGTSGHVPAVVKFLAFMIMVTHPNRIVLDVSATVADNFEHDWAGWLLVLRNSLELE
jgi:hypothetical protein